LEADGRAHGLLPSSLFCPLSALFCPSYGLSRELVFGRKHDGQHADRLFRVARVFAPVGRGEVVVVDFPEDALPIMFEGSEVVFAVGSLSSLSR
jgi:hypothetical protein